MKKLSLIGILLSALGLCHGIVFWFVFDPLCTGQAVVMATILLMAFFLVFSIVVAVNAKNKALKPLSVLGIVFSSIGSIYLFRILLLLFKEISETSTINYQVYFATIILFLLFFMAISFVAGEKAFRKKNQ